MPLELIDCPVCYSKTFVKLFASRDFRYNSCEQTFNIVKCEVCDFKFLSARPSEKNIDIFYKKNFHNPGNTFTYGIIRPFFNLVQRDVIQRIKSYKKRGRILDIGCGNGHILSLLANHGYDVYGVEPSSEAANYFPLSIKDRIFNKRIQECGFEDNFFDFVLMFQSLEHIHNLNALFVEIKRIIKPDGYMWIQVPNNDFFESRLFAQYYYNLEVPRHLYFFNRKSLCAVLRKEGFDNIKFVNNTFLELLCTPASFYFSMRYLLTGKDMPGKNLLMRLAYVPLVLLRFILRLLFIYDYQNLNVICMRA